MASEALVTLAKGLGGLLGLAAVAAPAGVLYLLHRLHHSVGLAPGTAAMRAEEAPATSCALFRHLPHLEAALAWRGLGAIRTPVHTCSIALPNGGRGAFSAKREDLSSSIYGGNKVRTLQHQLAVCEARIAGAASPTERAQASNIVVLGTGGSNQVVATVTHALQLQLPSVSVAWLQADLPDLDNTLNFLSTLSLPQAGNRRHWGTPGPMLRELLAATLGGGVVLPLGGNNPSGVLGQVGGMLELAEQIRDGEAPDPVRVYVPMGSSCTISGLILGVALTRHLGLPAFRSPDLKLVGVPIHPALAAAERATGCCTASWAQHVPFTVRHSIHSTCAQLVKLGGPDLLAESLSVMRHNLQVVTDPEIVGAYGGHSERSRHAAQLYEESMDMPGDAPPLWLCGHFAAKAFAVMLDDMQIQQHRDKQLLFWQTKSAVQPLGEVDEWEQLCIMPETVRHWADAGAAESRLRPGSVDTMRGTPTTYRPLMTPLMRSKDPRMPLKPMPRSGRTAASAASCLIIRARAAFHP